MDGYAQLLQEISGLTKEECLAILKEDMARRGLLTIESYFSDSMVTLRRVSEGKKNKKTVDTYVPSISNLSKSPGSLLFSFEDSLSHVLKGFTIDERIFHNLLRKMVLVKLNHDKVWCRQFYSQDLKSIFMVLKPLESVLENRALVSDS